MYNKILNYKALDLIVLIDEWNQLSVRGIDQQGYQELSRYSGEIKSFKT